MNIQRVKIGNIFLGEVDGESESRRKNFEELFYGDEETYNKLIDEEKFLVIGRKGTGKSFLGNYLVHKVKKLNKNYISKIYKGKDLNLYRLIKLGEFDIDVKEGELIWEYILLNIIAELLNERDSKKKYIPFTNEYRLDKLLKKCDRDFKISGLGKSKENSLKGGVKKKLKNEMEFTASKKETVNINYELKKYYDKIPQLKKIVFNVLKNTNTLIVLDDLDSMKIKEHMDKYYTQCISNLINITKEMNDEFKRLGDNNNKIIILLRDDIYEHLHDNDTNINKSTSNKYIKLDWWRTDNEASEFEHPLIKMILIKVKNSTPGYRYLSDEQLYKILFPKEIEEKPIINYLLEYSYGRPRDIIQFLNVIKDRHKGKKSFESECFRISGREYSELFFKELKNEIAIHEKSLMLQDTIKLIRNLNKINFSYNDISQRYTDNIESYPYIVDLKESLEYMYKLGVIGNTWKKHGSNPAVYRMSWGYRDVNGARLNLNNKMTVHKGLRKAFNL